MLYDASVNEGLFGVGQRVMILFYHAGIESILRYRISSWFGNIAVELKSQINTQVHTEVKVMEVGEHPSLLNAL